ncbi:Sec-independent protein translocase protein TatB [Lysobacter enzymogenes]|uniref:Sec-independent protein translocase protein TatB n=1 Tax=Lysobacter enzymogenes TaxID=69 RepID=A0A3N2RN70_LYSEN|nr:Sec-independent protein translocase protein TatB [Lysobacter enzymogenes]ROU08903.1 twin-arginine translocase subunit TatB [Lysobacter enzymogenes]
MFDIGFSEVFVIAIVALIVLGPERLPKAARFAGLWVRRARAQWYSVKSELERELADEELKRSLRQAQDELRSAQQQLRDGDRALRDGVDDLNRRVAGTGTAAAAGDDAAAAPRDPAALQDPSLGDGAANGAAPHGTPAHAEPSHLDYSGASQPDYRPSTAQTPNDERR